MHQESNGSPARRGATRWFWIAFVVAVVAALVLHGHVKDGTSSKDVPPARATGP